jgi:hypothetical protein
MVHASPFDAIGTKSILCNSIELTIVGSSPTRTTNHLYFMFNCVWVLAKQGAAEAFSSDLLTLGDVPQLVAFRNEV